MRPAIAPVNLGGRFDMAFSLIFLGSGTSQGVPVIAGISAGVFGKSKKSPHTPSITLPRSSEARRGHNAGIPDAGAARNIRWIDAVIFTHPHADHIMGWMIAGDFATCAAERCDLCERGNHDSAKTRFCLRV